MTNLRTRRASSRAATAAALTLLLAACGGGDGEADEADTTTPASSSGSPADESDEETTSELTSTDLPTDDAGAATSAPATTTTSTTTTTTTLPPRLGESPDDPAPVGDPAADLIGYASDGAVVDASIVGLVRLPPAADAPTDVDCVALLGTYTPTEVPGLVADRRHLPRVELLQETGVTPYAFSECDEDALRSAGWSPFPEYGVTAGTAYHFGQTFALPPGVEPTVIQVAVDSNPLVTYYEPTVLAELPPAPDRVVGALDVPLIDPGDPTAATITTVDRGATWEATIAGGVNTGRSERAAGDPGRCWTVLGTLKALESVGAIVDGLSRPDISLLVDGVIQRPDFGECDTDDLERAGYGSPLWAGIAIDNTYAFSESFDLAEGSEPTAIVVGRPGDADEYWLYGPTQVTTIPPAPESEGVNPQLDLVPVDTEVSVTATGGVAWRSTVFGLVELQNEAANATCYAVVGTVTADESPAFAPSIGLIADGGLYGRAITFVQCDSAPLEAAGYVDLQSIDDATEPTRFYVEIFLPDDVSEIAGIAVGNAASPDNVAYVEPVVLADLPG